MRDRGIAPGLLVASPDLRDENFTRTVVLMIQHDAESSFGLVVNRPTERRLSDPSAGLGLASDAHGGAAIFCGGPVPAQDGEPLGFVLHYRADADPEDADPEDADPEDADPEDTDPEDADPEDTDPEDTDTAADVESGADGRAGESRNGISLYTVPLDAGSLRKLETESPDHLRFVVGSARWAPGQLETELLYGAWLVAEADPDIIFQTPIDEIWEASVRSLGIDPATLLPGSLVANPVVH